MREGFGAKIVLTLVLTCLVSSAHLLAGQVVVDNSFGHAGALGGPNFSIGAGLGKQVGSNLFQSFGSFNLDKGEVANFTGPASINNVLARVSSPAAIDGTLQCTIPHANFYLIDAAGVVFGPNAKLDVQGSFAVIAADAVRLGQSGHFAANPSAASVLSSAAPSAFGFLGSKPARVSISGSALVVPAGQVASIISGDIQIIGGTVQSSGGRVNLVSAASRGQVALNAAAPRSMIGVSAAVASGNVSLSNSTINVDGSGGGQVIVRGGNLTFDNSAISANTQGAQNGRGSISASVVILICPAVRSRSTRRPWEMGELCDCSQSSST